MDEPLVQKYNVVGPLAKTAADLKEVFKVLTRNPVELKLDQRAEKIKVLYATELTPRAMMADVDDVIKNKILWIVKQLSKKFDVQQFDTQKFYYLPEVVTYKLVPMCRFRYFLQSTPTYVPGGKDRQRKKFPPLWKEATKCLFTASKFSFNLVYFEFVRRWKGKRIFL